VARIARDVAVEMSDSFPRRTRAVILDRNLKPKLVIMRQFTSVTDRQTINIMVRGCFHPNDYCYRRTKRRRKPWGEIDTVARVICHRTVLIGSTFLTATINSAFGLHRNPIGYYKRLSADDSCAQTDPCRAPRDDWQMWRVRFPAP